MDVVGTLMSTVVSGGATAGIGMVTGLLGSLVTTWNAYQQRKHDLKEKELDQAHDLAMVEAETNAMIAEKDAEIQVQREITEGKMAEGELEVRLAAEKKPPLFDKSYMQIFADKDGKPTWFGRFVAFIFAMTDIIKATLRPFMTYYIIFAMTWVTYLIWVIMKKANLDAMSATEALALFRMVIHFILFLASSTWSWWFCDRRTQKQINKMLEMK